MYCFWAYVLEIWKKVKWPQNRNFQQTLYGAHEEFSADSKFVGNGLTKMFWKKVIGKTFSKVCFLSILYFFPKFFAYNFLRNIVLGPFQRIWKQHKMFVFLHNTNFAENFELTLVIFANLGCKSWKNWSF